MMIDGIILMFVISQAGIEQAMVTVNVARAKATAVAQKVTVHLSIEAIVDSFEFSVALSRQRVAANSTGGTD